MRRLGGVMCGAMAAVALMCGVASAATVSPTAGGAASIVADGGCCHG